MRQGQRVTANISQLGEGPHKHPVEKTAHAQQRKSLPTPASSHKGSSEWDNSVPAPEGESAEEPLTSDVVDWSRPDDPENPLNWSSRKIGANVAVITFLTLLSSLAASIIAPAVPEILEAFETDNSLLATFVISVYLLGFALSPLLVAPLSEMYGRLPIYHVCNIFVVVFTVACALSTDMSMLIVFRFFSGCFGIAPATMGGGSLADIIPIQRRGRAMSIWSLGATQLRKTSGNPNLCTKLDRGLSRKQMQMLALSRPIKLTLFSPIAASLNGYMAVIYGIFYLLLTTFTFVFEESYGFSADIAGLAYMGLDVGMFIGLIIIGKTSDRILAKLAAKNNGQQKPEYHPPLSIVMGLWVPVGLFVFGRTAQYHVFWFVPILGGALFGFGIIAVIVCIQTYFIDCFGIFTASALAANTLLRSIVGALFPLFGLRLFDVLGLGWGSSLLAFVALALYPIPLILYRYELGPSEIANSLAIANILAETTVGYVAWTSKKPAYSDLLAEVLAGGGAVLQYETDIPQTLMSGEYFDYVFGRANSRCT
ncbi:putative Major facilitator superfamily (MFS) profile domain-containing protein [Seiridium cardinale]